MSGTLYKEYERMTKVTTGHMNNITFQRSYLTVLESRILVFRLCLRAKRLHHLRMPSQRFAFCLRDQDQKEAEQVRVWLCLCSGVDNVRKVTRLAKVACQSTSSQTRASESVCSESVAWERLLCSRDFRGDWFRPVFLVLRNVRASQCSATFFHSRHT